MPPKKAKSNPKKTPKKNVSKKSSKKVTKKTPEETERLWKEKITLWKKEYPVTMKTVQKYLTRDDEGQVDLNVFKRNDSNEFHSWAYEKIEKEEHDLFLLYSFYSFLIWGKFHEPGEVEKYKDDSVATHPFTIADFLADKEIFEFIKVLYSSYDGSDKYDEDNISEEECTKFFTQKIFFEINRDVVKNPLVVCTKFIERQDNNKDDVYYYGVVTMLRNYFEGDYFEERVDMKTIEGVLMINNERSSVSSNSNPSFTNNEREHDDSSVTNCWFDSPTHDDKYEGNNEDDVSIQTKRHSPKHTLDFNRDEDEDEEICQLFRLNESSKKRRLSPEFESTSLEEVEDYPSAQTQEKNRSSTDEIGRRVACQRQPVENDDHSTHDEVNTSTITTNILDSSSNAESRTGSSGTRSLPQATTPNSVSEENVQTSENVISRENNIINGERDINLEVGKISTSEVLSLHEEDFSNKIMNPIHVEMEGIDIVKCDDISQFPCPQGHDSTYYTGKSRFFHHELLLYNSISSTATSKKYYQISLRTVEGPTRLIYLVHTITPEKTYFQTFWCLWQ